MDCGLEDVALWMVFVYGAAEARSVSLVTRFMERIVQDLCVRIYGHSDSTVHSYGVDRDMSCLQQGFFDQDLHRSDHACLFIDQMDKTLQVAKV